MHGGQEAGVRAVKMQECVQGAEMVLQRRTMKNEEAPSAMVVPRGGGDRRRNTMVWLEKPAEEFARNLAVSNFGVRSTGLRVAAQKTGCTSRILASRAMPAYIYTQGSNILEIQDILGNN